MATVDYPQIPVTYPETKKFDHVDNYHGEKVIDPYHWLEDDNAEDTKAWVKGTKHGHL
jgi:prolyl oligopeptidase